MIATADSHIFDAAFHFITPFAAIFASPTIDAACFQIAELAG